VSQATEIYSREFDSIFLKLSQSTQNRLEFRIRELGRRLADYSHHRLQGRPECRLRAGDYRVIYEFNLARNELYLITLGHRREIYRVG